MSEVDQPEGLGVVRAAELAVAPTGPIGAEAVRSYVRAARSEATRRAYASDWLTFLTWCEAASGELGELVVPLPATPETVALFLADQAATLRPATLTRRCAAISTVHQARGFPTPTASPLVRTTMAGIRRVHSSAQAAKAPLLAHTVRRLIDALPKDPGKTAIATRDRCLLVLGFYGALRRSELVGLDVDDVTVNDQGLVVTVRRSKTDQEGQGTKLAMLHTGAADSCPVEVYEAWRAHLDIAFPVLHPEVDPLRVEDGRRPLLRGVTRHDHVQAARLSDRTVARVVQRTALAAGLGEQDFAGHSLRSGFATSAAAAGKSERAIMRQTGHKSLPMLRRYIREGSLFRDNATEGLTL